MRYTAAFFLLVASSAAAWSQPADAPVTFEVASIKPSPPPDGRGFRVGCPSDPGRITCTNMNMANLVTMAYGIAHYQLAGVHPSDMERYEIAVKVPEGATKDQIKLMWQNLLAERFKLAVHRETRQVTVYELSVAKGGLKMKESVEEPPPAADAPPPPPRPTASSGKPTLDKDGFPELGLRASMAIMGNKARWRAVKVTSAQIASMFGAQLGQPVTDATGLNGKYDFTLSWVTESRGGNRGAAVGGPPPDGSPLAGMDDSEAGPTLVQAIQSQLGLKLEQKKGPMETIVVDHVEKVPTEN